MDRYVCPANGQPSRCTKCKDAPLVAHRVEEYATEPVPGSSRLVRKGQKIPKCETHDVLLVLG